MFKKNSIVYRPTARHRLSGGSSLGFQPEACRTGVQ